MASPNTLQQNKAFTLVEVLVAVGVFTAMASIGLFFSFDAYRSYSFDREESVIVSILQKARNQSINNIDQTRHGVYFQTVPSLAYVLFECPASDPACFDYEASATDSAVASSYGVTVTSQNPLPFTVIFEQLSGNCITCNTQNTAITISNGITSHDITINTQGQIDWQ